MEFSSVKLYIELMMPGTQEVCEILHGEVERVRVRPSSQRNSPTSDSSKSSNESWEDHMNQSSSSVATRSSSSVPPQLQVGRRIQQRAQHEARREARRRGERETINLTALMQRQRQHRRVSRSLLRRTRITRDQQGDIYVWGNPQGDIARLVADHDRRGLITEFHTTLANKNKESDL